MKIPVSLSVYEHAARFIDQTPWAVSRDPDLLYLAHREAYKVYKHTPVIVGIDIYNLEAEAYGAQVFKPEGNGIPSIVSNLFASLDDALSILPFNPQRSGRIPQFIESATRLKADFPKADIRLPVSGPFSVAQCLVGLDNLILNAALEPEQTLAFLQKLVEGQLLFAKHIHEHGLGIAFFESAAAPPLLSPQMFRAIELPALKRAIEGVSKITGQPAPCIIGGNTAPIIPEMLETGTGFLICPAETNRREFLAGMKDHPRVKVRINMKPETYVRGSQEDIRKEIDEILALAQGKANILLGTGAIPYETPIENIRFILEYCL